MLEFEKQLIFTPCPQPIITLLGQKINRIQCGKDHVLALTDSREVYVWGSNSKGQLGLNKQLTEKQIELVDFVYEEKEKSPIKHSETPVDLSPEQQEESNNTF